MGAMMADPMNYSGSDVQFRPSGDVSKPKVVRSLSLVPIRIISHCEPSRQIKGAPNLRDIHFCRGISIGLRRTRKFDHGGAKLSWCGGARERGRRSWIGDQGWSGGGLDFGKPEWKAQHATECSGVKRSEVRSLERRLPKIAAPGGMPGFTRPPELPPQRARKGR